MAQGSGREVLAGEAVQQVSKSSDRLAVRNDCKWPKGDGLLSGAHAAIRSLNGTQDWLSSVGAKPVSDPLHLLVHPNADSREDHDGPQSRRASIAQFKRGIGTLEDKFDDRQAETASGTLGARSPDEPPSNSRQLRVGDPRALISNDDLLTFGDFVQRNRNLCSLRRVLGSISDQVSQAQDQTGFVDADFGV